MIVCILFGGESSEYEVSLRSAFSVLEGIDKEKYIVYKIGITRAGRWLLFEGDNREILEDKWHENVENKPLCVDFSAKGFVFEGGRIIPDVVIPIMHGEYGEDGRVQALLELMHIKKVGISASCAALCMDKLLSKTVAMRELIPVVPYIAVRDKEYELGEICDEIGESIEDVFVKPTRAGSSVGITRVRSRGELQAALDKAFKYSDTVLIEEAIIGHECEVAVLEVNGEIIVSDIGALSYKSDFYDYEAKYHSDGVKYQIPAKISKECRDLCKKYALTLFKALGCRGMSRIDFFVTDRGEVYFNEINAIPGFTDGSMYPMLMKNSGYELRALIDLLILSAGE